MAVNVNGGSTLATINSNGALGIGSVTLNAAAGVNTLDIVNSSGNPFFVWGIFATHSTAKQVFIHNGGWCQATIANWTGLSVGWTFLNSLSLLPTPDLFIVQETVNDGVQGTPISSFKASHQTLITALKNTGADVIEMIGPPPEVTQATQDPYAYVIRELCAQNKLIEINLTALLSGSWTNANTQGLMYDDYHCLQGGYAKAAAALTPILAQR